LDRWLNDSPVDFVDQKAIMNSTSNHEAPVAWEQLLHATDNDEELARELAVLFIESGQSSMQDILAALEKRDYGILGNKAHEIKGASANLQASPVREAAERLEAAAKNADAEQVTELAAQLKIEVERAVEYLRARVA
jgi:HPt (histidine-containing phosphotransfer) domain-containing protein